MSERPYNVILADPPWQFSAWGAGHKSRTAASQYQTMSPVELCSMGTALRRQCDAIAACFLWIPCSNLPIGLTVLAQWQVQFKTIAFTWIKLNSHPVKDHSMAAALQRVTLGTADEVPLITYQSKLYRPNFGMGHYSRQDTEICLLGMRGSMPVADRSVRQSIHAPVREHSRKPDEQYARIEAMYPGAAYVELFARQRRPGWAAHGDEREKFTPPEDQSHGCT